MKRLTAVVVLLPCMVVAGCANPGGIVPQQSTSLEALARGGMPTDIRFDRDGQELWEYATGPAGFHTWLLRLGPDGQIKEVMQLVNEERLLAIVPQKTTKQDVRHLLGRPSDVAFLRSGEAWSWRAQVGAQPGYLVVTFNPDNTVRERMAIVDPVEEESEGSN
jgi:hypothetical protein